MNKIEKTYPAPAILTTNGATLKDEVIAQVASGNTNLSFDSRIYGGSTVKGQLKQDQHNKCAFCEQTLNGDFGDVEHFRPKGGYKNKEEDNLTQPGYYWLAYDWDNLMLSCSICNRRYKKNLFPLLDETARNIGHRNISNETPLLINPIFENPGDHICFERHIIKSQITDGVEDLVGKTTIETFKLNDREDLVERRRQRWEEYECIIKLVRILEETADDERLSDLNIPAQFEKGKKLLDTIISEQSEFVGMFKYQVK